MDNVSVILKSCMKAVKTYELSNSSHSIKMSNGIYDSNESDSLLSSEVLSEELSRKSAKYDETSISQSKFCGIIPYNWILKPPHGQEIKVAPNNTPIKTVYLLLNAMIGSGILAQAYVFSQAGYLSTVLEYIVVGVLTYTGVELLIHASDKVELYDYASLSINALGYFGKYFIEISILMNNTGALLSYMIIIGSLSHDILITFSPPDVWYTSSAFVLLLVVIFIITPLCLIRNFGHLAIISQLSILAISITGIVVIIFAPLTTESFRMPLKVGSFEGSVRTIGSVIFAFGYASAVFHSYTAITPASRKPIVFNDIALTATSIGAFMCFCVGFVGYWSFRGDTKTGNVALIVIHVMPLYLVYFNIS